MGTCLLVRACMLLCLYAPWLHLSCMLRAMTHATARAKRQTRYKLETTCWAGEQGEGEVALSEILLGSDSLPSLYKQKVAVCGFCGKKHEMPLSVYYPHEARQAFPSSLPTLSTVI